ncbi:MAG TPA: pseudouridine-5'-phosphate glycosidase [Mycobacteriales bacterium]|nr:pseudouridine-5'-phosphate glycosidase [Mycobacteriales bacterium]
MLGKPFHLDSEVRRALAARRPVVALESTVLAHGLPYPRNVEVGRQVEAAVRAAGAVPATVAVLGGEVHLGLAEEALEWVCRAGVAKLGVRDLPVALATGRDGATTVASTAALAARAGIGVFATGGLGGVHRHARDSWDCSADLEVLARTPIAVVCAGVKSVLDVAATLERLETLSVAVLGYRTNRFPGFYLTDSGHSLDWWVDTPEQAAAVLSARDSLGLGSGAVVFANPLPPAEQLDPGLHDQVLDEALAALDRDGVRGKAVTPFLLDYFHRHTAGASLEVNVRIVARNAHLAGQIAAAYSPT